MVGYVGGKGKVGYKGRSGKGRVERVGTGGQGRAEHQHGQAKQLFSITILRDFRVTLCVCSEGSALFHIR